MTLAHALRQQRDSAGDAASEGSTYSGFDRGLGDGGVTLDIANADRSEPSSEHRGAGCPASGRPCRDPWTELPAVVRRRDLTDGLGRVEAAADAPCGPNVSQLSASAFGAA